MPIFWNKLCILCNHGNIVLFLTLKENTFQTLLLYTYCRNTYPKGRALTRTYRVVPHSNRGISTIFHSVFSNDWFSTLGVYLLVVFFICSIETIVVVLSGQVRGYTASGYVPNQRTQRAIKLAAKLSCYV